MKELLVIRHAKSSWANAGQDDFDRPLNDRGHSDAQRMAERLIKRGVKIDQFISSTAVRAITTATYFAEAYNRKKSEILQLQSLYHAPARQFFEVIAQIDHSVHCAAIFAHNPGITDFVLDLDTIKIDNMPTCGIFAVKLHTDDWKKIRSCKKECWFFDYPKLA